MVSSIIAVYVYLILTMEHQRIELPHTSGREPLTEYQTMEEGVVKAKRLEKIVDLSQLVDKNHENLDCMLIQWFDLLVQSLQRANVLESSYETSLFDDESGIRSLLAYGEDKCFVFRFTSVAPFDCESNVYDWVREIKAPGGEVDRSEEELTDGSKLLAKNFKKVSLKSFWTAISDSPDMTMIEAERTVSFFLHGAYCSLIVAKEVKDILPVDLRVRVDEYNTLGELLNAINKEAKLVLSSDIVHSLHKLSTFVLDKEESIDSPHRFRKSWQSMEKFFEYMNEHPQLYERAFFLLLAQKASAFNNEDVYQDILDWGNIHWEAIKQVRSRHNSGCKRERWGNSVVVEDPKGQKKDIWWISDGVLKELRKKLDSSNAIFTQSEVDLIRHNISAFELNLKKLKPEYHMYHEGEGDPLKSEYERIIDVMLAVEAGERAVVNSE